MTYIADPVCDDVNATLPLEVHTLEFTSEYYVSFQGNHVDPSSRILD